MTEAPSDRLDTIHREKHQVEDTMRQLHERRAMLLQRLNERQASTRALPPEVLSLIFEHTCPEDTSFCTSDDCCALPNQKDIYSVFTLGHVSSHWRRVAWSTPQLWTDMDVCVRKENAVGIPCILELHLQNVGSLPFTLMLNIIASGSERAFLAAIQPIKLLLDNAEYSKKIQALHLEGAPASWASSISSNFSRLESLEIGGPVDSPFALESVPLLRHLSLFEACGDISISGSSITKLDLNNVPINACARLLTQCPSLTYFGSVNPRDETALFHPPTSTIILHHLQELLWSYHDSPPCLAVLEAVKLPALHTLTWLDQCLPAPIVEPSIRALIDGRLDTLLTLELSIPEWTESLIKHVFDQCHRVQSLRLLEYNNQCLDEVLSVLLLGWDGSGTRYLPSLASLTIDSKSKLDGYEAPATDLPTVHCSRRILELCRAKGTGSNLDSRFELRLDDVSVDWPPEVQEDLCELVRNGFQLDIFVCGEREPWLP